MYVRFEDGRKYTKKNIEDQELSDTTEDFDSAGYILEDYELVVDIDCLSKEQIKSLIETFNLKTKTVWTDRGVHLYFRKPRNFRRAQGTTIFGFKVEYKHQQNTYAITVKQNGVLREMEHLDVLKPLPKILEPTKNKVLLGYDEGDGRNDALYNTKRLCSQIENPMKILSFINNHIFDKPLPNEEFEAVARDEVFEAGKDGENLVADMIMKENRVILHQNSLFYYDDGHYNNDEDVLRRIVYEYCPGMKTRYVDEVIKQMRYRTEMESIDKEFKIKLKNGYLYHGEFYEYEFTGFTPYYIDVDYNPNAEPVQKIDDYLNQLSNNDPDYKDFILEIIANSLITDNKFKRHLAKFFIFVGDGGNGKGTLLQIITEILGDKNVSANSISELMSEKYLNTLVGKLANLGDDIQDEPIDRKAMKVLKNLSTGDRIQTRRLYENPVTVRLNPTLIFTSNHVLKSFDKDYSYKRRVVWLPMYTKPEVADPDFINQLTTPEALEYWLKLIIEAYFRLYERKEYTHSSIVDDFNQNYHMENDSTIEYVSLLKNENIEFKRTPEVYEDYKVWCETNGLSILNPKYLKATILNKGYVLKSHRLNGTVIKCYMRDKEHSNLKVIK